MGSEFEGLKVGDIVFADGHPYPVQHVTATQIKVYGDKYGRQNGRRRGGYGYLHIPKPGEIEEYHKAIADRVRKRTLLDALQVRYAYPNDHPIWTEIEALTAKYTEKEKNTPNATA